MNDRNFWILVVIVSCLGFAAPEDVLAQDRIRLHGTVGVTKAMSPTNFSNRYRIGFYSSASVGYELTQYGFEPVVSGMYTRYNIDPAAMGGGDVSIRGGGRSIWGISAGTYFHMNSGSRSYNGRRHLYLIGQVGVRGLNMGSATVRTADTDASWEGRSEVRPGAVFGLGMEFPIGRRLSFKLEPALDVMFTKGERTSALLLNTGLIFSGR